ncbi:MAG: 3-deoxy-manno-octulosonate cytidylyltransferase [Rhodoferax sp.]
MSYTVLIPARLASTRLPRKPLVDIGGLPMVVRVARQLTPLAEAGTQVVVAADAQEIVDACAAHGVSAILTNPDHPSGSDRLAQACSILGLSGEQVVVNVQGDEPLMEPGLVHQVATLLQSRQDCVAATAAHPLDNEADIHNPNVVKVVLDRQQRALLFSRAPIPLWRDAASSASRGQVAPLQPLRHIGLYAYRAAYLRGFPLLEQPALEICEALEQLRILWHGDSIAVHVTQHPPGPGVDTEQDLANVRQLVALGQPRA